MTCSIVGDSIALGLSIALHGACWTRAVVGAPASRIASWPVQPGAWTAISAGSNDPGSTRLAGDLERIRSRAEGVVVWILPTNGRARAIAVATAKRHGDAVVSFVPGRDGVHPRSYAVLGRKVRQAVAGSNR